MTMRFNCSGDRDQCLSAFATRRGVAADVVLQALSRSGSERLVKLCELATGLDRPKGFALHDTAEVLSWCSAVVAAVLPENLRADLPKGAPARLKAAAARLGRADLQAVVPPAPASKQQTPAAPKPAPVPPVKPAAPVAPNAEQIRSLAKVLGGVDAGRVIEAEGHAAALELLDRLCFQAHLRAPWWTENRQAELGADYWRPDARTITGLVRTIRTMKQRALEQTWSKLRKQTP